MIARMSKGWKFRSAALAAVLLAAPARAQAPAAERGAGPFLLQTARGPLTVRLLRRDKDMVWFLMKTSSGDFVETGMKVSEIARFEIARPTAFDYALRASTPAEVEQARAALQRITSMLKPFRDLPGMIADEAQLLEGRTLEKKQAWPDAFAVYQDLAAQPHKPPQAAEARVRAGICAVRTRQYDKAVDLLQAITGLDDNPEAMAEAYLARAEAHLALRKFDEAALDCLYPVVFFPFASGIEARCLAEVLPCYAEMKDWEAASLTLEALRRDYPDSEPTRKAEAFAQEHERELNAEIPYKIQEEDSSTKEGKVIQL